MEGIKWKRIELQSDRAENHNQTGPFWDRKSEILDLKCFVSISRIVLPVRAGSTFSEKTSNKWSENEKWSRKTLDGKCDGYMSGLGGVEKRKFEKY